VPGRTRQVLSSAGEKGRKHGRYFLALPHWSLFIPSNSRHRKRPKCSNTTVGTSKSLDVHDEGSLLASAQATECLQARRPFGLGGSHLSI
jgi:hypothetical protein